MADHLDQYRRELDESNFENQTLRKDLRELTGSLKDFQEREFRGKQLERVRIQDEIQRQEGVKVKDAEVAAQKARADE